MQKESLPALSEILQAVEGAAVDVYGFATTCVGGLPWIAESEILDVLFLGLESFWFTTDFKGNFSHQEYREEFFHHVWLKVKKITIKSNEEMPLGHEEMLFYQLPLLSRAALYLRAKKKFSYKSLSFILESDEGVLREEIEKAREFLLGKRLRPFEWSEEDF